MTFLVPSRRAALAAALLLPFMPAAWGFAETPAPAAAPTLKVGDPAPALQVLGWLKGTPVPELRKGQVYVVEFWATWCGGCVGAMPHLTELAKTYEGKVTFIGVDVWEREHGNSKRTDADVDAILAAFLKGKGAAMGYAVAQDTRDGAMARRWLDAAGVQGIPAAFLIDADGRIAMIDHPSRLDAALPQLLAGNRDFQKQRSVILNLF
jgi:thiol-disulfide isomerase/thioredoxin